jgi:hypothetical protein
LSLPSTIDPAKYRVSDRTEPSPGDSGRDSDAFSEPEESMDLIVLGRETYAVFIDNPTKRIPASLQAQYTDYLNGSDRKILAIVENPLKMDHPEAFEGGICTDEHLKMAGLMIRNRHRLEDLMGLDDLLAKTNSNSLDETPYLVFPSPQPGHVRIERTSDLFKSACCAVTLYRHKIHKNNVSIYGTDGIGFHPIGNGDHFWTTALIH